MRGIMSKYGKWHKLRKVVPVSFGSGARSDLICTYDQIYIDMYIHMDVCMRGTLMTWSRNRSPLSSRIALVCALGFRVSGFWFLVSGFWFSVEGLGFRVWGSGCGV